MEISEEDKELIRYASSAFCKNPYIKGILNTLRTTHFITDNQRKVLERNRDYIKEQYNSGTNYKQEDEYMDWDY